MQVETVLNIDLCMYVRMYVRTYSKCISAYNIDSCNHICIYVPPEMKATIDELTKRTTEKEAEMVHQVVHCSMYAYVHTRHICT